MSLLFTSYFQALVELIGYCMDTISVLYIEENCKVFSRDNQSVETATSVNFVHY